MSRRDKSQQFAALQQQGVRALQQGAIKKATALLKEAHALHPEDRDVRLNLSSALILSKKFREAIPLLEKLTEEAPENPMFWLNLGAAYLGNPVLARDEEQLQAIEAFSKAYELNPRTPNVAYNLGLVFRDRREYLQARRWFQRAAAAFPEDQDAAFYIQQMTERLTADSEG